MAADKPPGRYVTLEDLAFAPRGGQEIWIVTGSPRYAPTPIITVKHQVRPMAEGLQITEVIDYMGQLQWVNRIEWRSWSQFKVPVVP